MPELGAESCLFRVGYALPARKIEAFMVESFITYAKQQADIDFIPIHISKPLTEQGPFDCIIHKLYDHQWNLILEDYAVNHPNTTIIDRPSAIQRLHNRISMLEPVSQLNIPKLTIPHQHLVHDSESLESIQTKSHQLIEVVADHTSFQFQTTIDLVFPLIAKPLLADGTTNAHNMSLVFNHEGLTKLDLEPPMVLQQFVNHGGVIFKVYVAGDYVKCVKRSSLPDVTPETMKKLATESGGIMSFSQISSSVITGDDGWSSYMNFGEKLKMPAPEFVVEVAKGLRQALGLHLFNFDMMRISGDSIDSDGYLVVDINYFPGYEKLPGYESVMTDFFLSVKKSQEETKITGKENVEVDKTQA